MKFVEQFFNKLSIQSCACEKRNDFKFKIFAKLFIKIQIQIHVNAEKRFNCWQILHLFFLHMTTIPKLCLSQKHKFKLMPIKLIQVKDANLLNPPMCMTPSSLLTKFPEQLLTQLEHYDDRIVIYKSWQKSMIYY